MVRKNTTGELSSCTPWLVVWIGGARFEPQLLFEASEGSVVFYQIYCLKVPFPHLTI